LRPCARRQRDGVSGNTDANADADRIAAADGDPYGDRVTNAGTDGDAHPQADAGPDAVAEPGRNQFQSTFSARVYGRPRTSKRRGQRARVCGELHRYQLQR